MVSSPLKITGYKRPFDWIINTFTLEILKWTVICFPYL